jgi:hypothetical protein
MSAPFQAVLYGVTEPPISLLAGPPAYDWDAPAPPLPATATGDGGWVCIEDADFGAPSVPPKGDAHPIASSRLPSIVVRACVPVAAAAAAAADGPRAPSPCWSVRDQPTSTIVVQGATFSFSISISHPATEGAPRGGEGGVSVLRLLAAAKRAVDAIPVALRASCGHLQGQGPEGAYASLLPPADRARGAAALPEGNLPRMTEDLRWRPYDLQHDGAEAAGSWALHFQARYECREAIYKELVPFLALRMRAALCAHAPVGAGAAAVVVPILRFRDWGTFSEQLSLYLRVRFGSSCFRLPAALVLPWGVDAASLAGTPPPAIHAADLRTRLLASEGGGGCHGLHQHRIMCVHVDGGTDGVGDEYSTVDDRAVTVVLTDVLVSCSNARPDLTVASGTAATAASVHVEYRRMAHRSSSSPLRVDPCVLLAQLLVAYDPDVVAAHDWRPFLTPGAVVGASARGRGARGLSGSSVVGGRGAVQAIPLQAAAISATAFGRAALQGAAEGVEWSTSRFKFEPLELLLAGRAAISIAAMSDHMYRKGDDVRHHSRTLVARDQARQAGAGAGAPAGARCPAVGCLTHVQHALALSRIVTRSSTVATMLQYAWVTYGVSLGGAYRRYQSEFGQRDLRFHCRDEERGVIVLTSPRGNVHLERGRDPLPEYALRGGLIRNPPPGVYASIDITQARGARAGAGARAPDLCGGPLFSGDLKTAYPQEVTRRSLCPSNIIFLPVAVLPPSRDGDTELTWRKLPTLDHARVVRDGGKRRKPPTPAGPGPAPRAAALPARTIDGEECEPSSKRPRHEQQGTTRPDGDDVDVDEEEEEEDDDDDAATATGEESVAWVCTTRPGVLDSTLRDLAVNIATLDAAFVQLRARGEALPEAWVALRTILKLKSNTIYGCTAERRARTAFCGRHVAAYITHGVRVIVGSVVKLLERWGFAVPHIATDGFTAHATSTACWRAPAMRSLSRPTTAAGWRVPYCAVLEGAMRAAQGGTSGHRMVLEAIYAGGVVSLGGGRLLFYAVPTGARGAPWKVCMPSSTSKIFTGLGTLGSGGSGASLAERAVLLRAARAAVITPHGPSRTAAIRAVLLEAHAAIVAREGVFSDADAFLETVALTTPKVGSGLAPGDVQGASVVMSTMRLAARTRRGFRPGAAVPMVRVASTNATRGSGMVSASGGGSIGASAVVACCGAGKTVAPGNLALTLDVTYLAEKACCYAWRELVPDGGVPWRDVVSDEIATTHGRATVDVDFLRGLLAVTKLEARDAWRVRSVGVTSAGAYPRVMRVDQRMWPAGHALHTDPVSLY